MLSKIASGNDLQFDLIKKKPAHLVIFKDNFEYNISNTVKGFHRSYNRIRAF